MITLRCVPIRVSDTRRHWLVLPSEPEWLPLREIIETNREEVGLTGEPHLVWNHGLLEMACDRPRNTWHYGEDADMASLAVALLLGIAKNHPFAQGNKRTAFQSARQFLLINGFDLDLPDSEDFADLIIAAVEGLLSEHQLAAEFRAGLIKL